ncbi:MAG: ion transporter [Cyanobacteria bacterium P01_A01_bin.135]
MSGPTELNGAQWVWGRWLKGGPAHLGGLLDDIESSLGRSLNLLIALLVLLSCAIYVIETYPISAALGDRLRLVDRGILAIFSVEYLVRLWCADHKLRYLISPYALVDLVAIAPFFLGLFDISILLVFRWFRVLRLVRLLENARFGSFNSEDLFSFARILLTLFTIVFVYSGLIYQVEHVVNPQGFRTMLDALYFAVATMTTVGFGDITPISEAGRLLTILMIWTGIAFIPWQIGELVTSTLKGLQRVERPCQVCGTAYHDGDARFCRVCGSSLSVGDDAKANAGATGVEEPTAIHPGVDP